MVCIAQHKAKLEAEAFQSQREKIENRVCPQIVWFCPAGVNPGDGSPP